MRVTLVLSLFVLIACPTGDPRERVPFDAGSRVDNDAGDADADAGWRYIDASIHDSGATQNPDGGTTANDGGATVLPTDGGAPADGGDGEDAGRAADANDPAPGAIERGPSERLTRRTFVCAGQEITRVDITWTEAGAIDRVRFDEVGEMISSFRVESAAGKPLSASGRNDRNQIISGLWQWGQGDRLSAAQATDGDGILSWAFTYGAADRLTLFTSSYEVDGEIDAEAFEVVWGELGPTAWGASAITYAAGLPVSFGAAALTYDGDHLAGVPEVFSLVYGDDGLLAEVDMGEGCGFHFTWEAGEAQWFTSALPIDGLGGLFDAQGRYVGDYVPGRNLYLSMMLLGAE
jgi:hypothetical protein